MPVTHYLKFKAHRNSDRVYEVHGTSPSVFFMRAALESAGWVIVDMGAISG